MDAQHLEMEGLAKMEAAVAGSEAEGFYGLLRGVISHSSLPTSSPPPKKACCAPSVTVSHLHPQESTGPEAFAPAEQALESASLNVPPVLEEEIPAHMQPLHIQLGASRGCTDVRLRAAKRAHQPLMLPFVPKYERYIWGGGGVPPMWQVFLQSQYLQASQKRSY